MLYYDLHWSEKLRVAPTILLTNEQERELAQLARSKRNSVRVGATSADRSAGRAGPAEQEHRRATGGAVYAAVQRRQPELRELRHKAINDRIGRYPHRNTMLGRTSSVEELAYLSEPGSSF